jgi:hypothetical protein
VRRWLDLTIDKPRQVSVANILNEFRHGRWVQPLVRCFVAAHFAYVVEETHAQGASLQNKEGKTNAFSTTLRRGTD